jgi:hypothetical protein
VLRLEHQGAATSLMRPSMASQFSTAMYVSQLRIGACSVDVMSAKPSASPGSLHTV